MSNPKCSADNFNSSTNIIDFFCNSLKEILLFKANSLSSLNSSTLLFGAILYLQNL